MTEKLLTRTELETLAAREEMSPDCLAARLAAGRIVIVRNPAGRPLAIGEGCHVKVNANIGTAPGRVDVAAEIAKLKAAEAAGADAVMDLSTGGDLPEIRRQVIAESTLAVGSVPIYAAAVAAVEKYGDIGRLGVSQLWEKIEEEAASGVSFITVHTGVSEAIVRGLAGGGRLINMVSRGGSLLACWMNRNRRENPLLEDFPRLLSLAARYRLTLSLGDGMRPGAIADNTDRFQLEELFILGEQARQARAAGVQVLIEGPGHIPLDRVALNVQLAKQATDAAPLYLLGPLVTDIAPGYDHITGAIGGAVAAMAGADFLCYVTPAEHLGLPTAEDVREGVYASRIAAHAADLTRGKTGALAWDRRLSEARRDRDWAAQKKLSLNPDRFRDGLPDKDQGEVCSMCGDYCAMRYSEQLSGSDSRKQ